MSSLREVTTFDFGREVIQSDVPVLVDFYADWCNPCKMLAPILDRLASEFSGRVKFVKVNIDESPELAKYFRIGGVPALRFFQGGQLVDTVNGLADIRTLRNRLNRLLRAAASPVFFG